MIFCVVTGVYWKRNEGAMEKEYDFKFIDGKIICMDDCPSCGTLMETTDVNNWTCDCGYVKKKGATHTLDTGV